MIKMDSDWNVVTHYIYLGFIWDDQWTHIAILYQSCLCTKEVRQLCFNIPPPLASLSHWRSSWIDSSGNTSAMETLKQTMLYTFVAVVMLSHTTGSLSIWMIDMLQKHSKVYHDEAGNTHAVPQSWIIFHLFMHIQSGTWMTFNINVDTRT